MNIPSNQDFATEVKFDRLKVLWRVTIILSFIAGWIVLNAAMLQRMELVRPLLPVALMIGGSLMTRYFLNRNHYVWAAWIYILAALVSLTLLLTVSPLEMINVYIFFYAMIIFIVGLLLPPTNTLLLALVSSLLLTFVPSTVLGGMDYFGPPQIAAIVMTFFAAIIAMQVTGDLYQIAEWAMQNYQRERRVAAELFDSRQEVEKGFVRARALGERLQETNVELDAARGAAEEAKHFRGQFLANMSHELRTPLNAIIGFSETMLKFPAMYDGVKLPNAYEADLQQIYTSGKQLLNLINDILDLAKVDAGKLDIRIERLELKPVINSVLSTASGLLAGKPIDSKPTCRMRFRRCGLTKPACVRCCSTCTATRPSLRIAGRSKLRCVRWTINCKSPSPIRAWAFRPPIWGLSSRNSNRRAGRDAIRVRVLVWDWRFAVNCSR